MSVQLNRPINDAEAAVVRIALERCAEVPEASELLPSVGGLQVESRCDCGCASVDFSHNSSEHPRPIADGIGVTSYGDRVGIIVWGVKDAITRLEIYDMSTSASDLLLTDIQSIISYTEAAE